MLEGSLPKILVQLFLYASLPPATLRWIKKPCIKNAVSVCGGVFLPLKGSIALGSLLLTEGSSICCFVLFLSEISNRMTLYQQVSRGTLLLPHCLSITQAFLPYLSTSLSLFVLPQRIYIYIAFEVVIGLYSILFPLSEWCAKKTLHQNFKSLKFLHCIKLLHITGIGNKKSERIFLLFIL